MSIFFRTPIENAETMLSKAICQRCYKSFNHQWFRIDEVFGNGKALTPDLRWKQGFVSCFTYRRSIRRSPPVRCPFVLEHLMETQSNA